MDGENNREGNSRGDERWASWTCYLAKSGGSKVHYITTTIDNKNNDSEFEIDISILDIDNLISFPLLYTIILAMVVR